VTYAVLTEAGLRKISEARDAHHRDIEELFGAKFSEDELSSLDELLRRLPLADTACQA
jgi:DNA-binding MarR family transcriptional regulator